MLPTNLSVRSRAVELVLISFAVLFQELTLIRWLGSQIRVLAYFPNVVLMGAFLGLGVGCLRARGKSLLWLWSNSLLLLTAATWGMSKIAFTQESVSEHLWLLYYDMKNAPVIHGVRLPIVVTFLLVSITFIAPGQMVAQRLAWFGEKGPRASLAGYSFDLLGSLLGVGAFALASFFCTFPIVWFAVVLLIVSCFTLRAPRKMAAVVSYILRVVAIILLVIKAEGADRYSPYYALRTDINPVSNGVNILANGSLHQYAAPVAGADQLIFLFEQVIRAGYHSPYRLLQKTPRRLLVLGAGSGNDIATALDEGVEHIDAVEIDPVIQQIGRQMHPDHPYASPRVTAINTDARSFLNRSDEKYDLIVFGTLDSMTRLSAMSSVRLDNFVYTRDCLEAAKRHLTNDGGVVMYFMVGSQYIHDRLRAMLASVFGEQPFILSQNCNLFNDVLMDGPAFAHLRATLPTPPPLPAGVILPSDDWPYLYLRDRSVDSFYLSLIGSFIVLSVATVAIASPSLFKDLLHTDKGFDAEMFLFGAAFLLLETKSVTEMNLVWGVTWLTSAVVFGSILIMLLAATVTIQFRRIPWRVATVGLILSLAVNYLIPTQLLIGRNVLITLLFSMLFIGLPIFFASVCFALRFTTKRAPDAAFGWNLLGAVAGGLLEFSSMAIGFKALSLLAIAAYLAAFVRSIKSRQTADMSAAALP
jgi:Spermine/spermidine synthase domain